MAVTTKTQLYDGTFDTRAVVITIFIALSLYNAVELISLILFTFKRWRGLYFLSLTVATAGVIPYSIGMLFWFFEIGPSYAGAIPNNIGWISMVTGQSLVLYSRLHLLLRNERLLNGVFWMIVVDSTVLYIPTTIVQFGSYDTRDYANFKSASCILEKFQMTAFAIQELIISALYMREILRLARFNIFEGDKRRTLLFLGGVQVVIILLDLGLLVLEYLNLVAYQETFKSLSYSMKLKMEFAVLGKLIDSVSRTRTIGREVGMERQWNSSKSPPATTEDAVTNDIARNDAAPNYRARSSECLSIPDEALTPATQTSIELARYTRQQARSSGLGG